MLTALDIQNLVTVDSLELEFDAGMTTLTGETGAGKSILIDALGLALGDKADSGMIRSGADKAEISALFDISDVPQIKKLLEEQEFKAEDDEILIRRVITTRGRSRAYINGSPATLGAVAGFSEQLVNIHGQHAHQTLTQKGHQRKLLDAFAGQNRLAADVRSAWLEWRSVRESLESLKTEEGSRASRRDLLAFQIDELQELQLGENEWQELGKEHNRLSHADTLAAECQQINESLYGESGAAHNLERSVASLEAMLKMDPGLEELTGLLRSALIELQEASPLMRSYGESVELDPERLAQVDERLSAIHSLARKQRIEPQLLVTHLDDLEQEYRKLENTNADIEALEVQLEQLQQQWHQLADKLSLQRKKAAAALSDTVTRQMKQLAMPDGKFSVRLTEITDDEPAANGKEQVEFLVTANPGQAEQPLAKVASGGELSRISLAIQVATAGLSDIPTLIFDEVDVGIGGGVAEIVGRLLREIGSTTQVLCVTHLPQVAAQGHSQQRVDKLRGDDSTRTAVTQLDGEQRIAEIARMLGGVEVTERTLEHAREMLQKADKRAS